MKILLYMKNQVEIRPQEGSEVKIYGFDMFCISRSRARCKKPHQKILFLTEVMDFFKYASQYNYYVRANFKLR